LKNTDTDFIVNDNSTKIKPVISILKHVEQTLELRYNSGLKNLMPAVVHATFSLFLSVFILCGL